MINVRELESDIRSLTVVVNEFLNNNLITRKNLIDIKYLSIKTSQIPKTRVLIIYETK